MKKKLFSVCVLLLTLLVLASCGITMTPTSAPATTPPVTTPTVTEPPVTSAPEGGSTSADTSAPPAETTTGTTLPPAETTTKPPAETTTGTTLPPAETTTEPKPETVSVTIKSDIAFRPFYDHQFLSSDFVTELTVTLPYETYTSELEFVFEDTKTPSQSTYKVKALLLDGASLERPAALTADAALTLIPVELYTYTFHFANDSFEMIEAELGRDIEAALAETCKGNLSDLLSSTSGGGYINLPTFYTDESRSESFRVTQFSPDFTEIWLGKKPMPRLTLVCIEQCTMQHEADLWIGYITSDMLLWHGVDNEADGLIEVSFYLDPDCTVPYVEGEPPTYYTEDVTLYGKPSRDPSAEPIEATIYLSCPACGTIGTGRTYFGLTLLEMIEGCLFDCCGASAADYRWYTYDGTGMTHYFTDAELGSYPTRTELSVFGEPSGNEGEGGGEDGEGEPFCRLTIVCHCASCTANGGSVTVTVPTGATLADAETLHEHGQMMLIFTYYRDAAYTEEIGRASEIVTDLTLYAYHPDVKAEITLYVSCTVCSEQFTLTCPQGATLDNEPSLWLHACCASSGVGYYRDPDGLSAVDPYEVFLDGQTLYIVGASTAHPLLRIVCYACGAEMPAIYNDGNTAAEALLGSICSCNAPRELWGYDPSSGEYLPIEPSMPVPAHCTELVNDPSYTLTVICDCGDTHVNSAQISKQITVNELLMNYASCVHPAADAPICFFRDEGHAEEFHSEEYLREHLTVYASCKQPY